MIIQKNCDFVTNSATPQTSRVFTNPTGDLLTIQISGSSGVYYVEGRSGQDGDWVSLGGINLTDFTAVTGAFTTPGIYEIGIPGIRELRVRVNKADGPVTIFGQIIDLEGL
jgi:hypothetical protein